MVKKQNSTENESEHGLLRPLFHVPLKTTWEWVFCLLLGLYQIIFLQGLVTAQEPLAPDYRCTVGLPCPVSVTFNTADPESDPLTVTFDATPTTYVIDSCEIDGDITIPDPPKLSCTTHETPTGPGPYTAIGNYSFSAQGLYIASYAICDNSGHCTVGTSTIDVTPLNFTWYSPDHTHPVAVPPPYRIMWQWNQAPNATSYDVWVNGSYSTTVGQTSSPVRWNQDLSNYNISSGSVNIYAVRYYGLDKNGNPVYEYLPVTGGPKTYFSQAAIPSSPTCVVNSSSQITWNWTSGGGQKDYFASNAGGNSGWIATTQWVQLGLTPNTTYTTLVKARNNDNEETATVSVGCTTPAQTFPPNIPTNLSGSGTSTTNINWSWTASVVDATHSAATSYFVYDTAGNYLCTATAPATSCVAPGAGSPVTYSANGTYSARVLASNSAGSSGLSTPDTAYTLPNSPGTPSASNIQQTQITWSWSAPVPGGSGSPPGYDNNYVCTLNDANVNNATSCTSPQIFTSLTCNTSYTVRVWARNQDNQPSTNPSTDTRTTTACTFPPNIPTNLSGSGTSTTNINWSWTASVVDATHSAATSYFVYDTAGNYLCTATAPATSCVAPGAGSPVTYSANGTYSARVLASNSAGSSGLSTPDTAYTLPNSPGTPSASNIQQTQITWSWSAPVPGGSGSPPGYDNNYVCTLNDANVNNATSCTSPQIFTSLTCNTSYTVRVWARNQDNQPSTNPSTDTRTTTACTFPPNIPTNLSGSGTSTTNINWSWTASVVDATHSAATSYFVYDTAGNYLCTATAPATSCVAPGAGSPVTYSANGTYSARVLASNSAGSSGLSTPDTAYTLPNSPGTPSASNIQQTQITWSWSAPVPGGSGSPPGYDNNYVCTLNDANVNNATSCTSPQIFTSLTCNTSYTVRVWARNQDNQPSTNPSTDTRTTTACTFPPNIPTNLSGSGTSTTNINWSWTASVVDATHSAATSYFVYDTAGNYLCTATAPATSCVAPGAGSPVTYSANGTYSARVLASNSAGSSGLSTPDTAYTLPNSPGTPSASNIQQTQITWSWSAPVPGGSGSPPGYDNNYVCTLNDANVNNATSCTSPQTFTSLTCNTSYTVRVWARNQDNQPSTNPSTDTRTTTACTFPPNIPTNLSGSGTSTTNINWSWTASVVDATHSAATSYFVYDTAGNYLCTATAPATSCVAPGAGSPVTYSANGTYSARVLASNSAGSSGLSTPDTAYTLPNSPGTPSASNIQQTQITWSWSAPVPGGSGSPPGYDNNYVCTLNDANVNNATSCTSPQIFTSLTCNTSYTVRVWARNQDNQPSTNPSTDTRTTTACTFPPNIPTNLSGSGTSTTNINWSWTASVVDATHSAATSYFVYDTAGNYLCTATAPATSCVAPGAGSPVTYSANGTYSARVLASNSAGSSGLSTPDTAYTLPNSPGTPSASNIQQTQITWSWSAPVPGGSGSPPGYDNNYVCTLNDANVNNATSCTSPQTFTSLTCNTSYTVRVWARNQDNQPSTNPSTDTRTTSICIGRSAALTINPVPPSGWAASPTSVTLTPSCTAEGGQTLQACVVQVNVNGAGWNDVPSPYPATYASFVSGSAYQFRAREQDTGGSITSVAAPNPAYQFDNIPPNQINGLVLTGSPTNSQFTIAWNPASDAHSGLARYELWRAPNQGASPGAWSKVKDVVGVTNTTDTPPSSGVWWYGVHAVDKAGNWSSEANPPGPVQGTYDVIAPAAANHNPAKGSSITELRPSLTVVLSDNLTGIGVSTIKVYNEAGQNVLTKNFASGNTNLTVAASDWTVPLSRKADGSPQTYTVQIISADGAGNTLNDSSWTFVQTNLPPSQPVVK